MGRTYRGLNKHKKEFLKKQREGRNKRSIKIEPRTNDGQTKQNRSFYDDGFYN